MNDYLIRVQFPNSDKEYTYIISKEIGQELMAEFL